MLQYLIRCKCVAPICVWIPYFLQLEPIHRVTVENPKMRWNETNRNLVYTMMNMYKHAQNLKKNLSAQALKGISLEIASSNAQ